ncbi:AsmA-like C-terminal domain-containing protein, partial [Aliarcobacter skirrowii]|uniref:AsmA-like C-terminal domain-containing protein n=1 Tax=Aliarcobacter skirrowii TaxID=28200 RepID=UPI0029BEB731
SSKGKKDGIKNIKVDLKNSTLDIFSQKFYIKNGEVKIEDDESILFNALVATPKLPIILHKNKKEVDYFDIKGRYKDDIVDISTINDDLLLNIDKNNYTIFTKEYEIFYNTPNKDKSIEEDSDSKLGIKLFVSGEDTTFILNNKNRVIATKYELNVDDNRKFIYLENQDMKFTYSEDKEGYLDIFLYDANSSFINALSDKKILQNGSIDMFASGTMQDLKGELFVKDSLIKDLSLINNILFFVQTSPALINPLFAIPSALNINNIGNYSIQKGRVEFSYSNKTNILDLKNINVIGNGMDFEGNAKIFLDNHTIDSSLNLIFMKTYSNVVNVLPIVNYILLGDNKRVESKIHLSGDLSDPKIDSNFLKDSVNAPVNIFKRVINSPFDIFNSLMKKDEEKKEDE